MTKNYVGFWPWPRVWGTKEARDLGLNLPGGDYLEAALTEEQSSLFRKVAASYSGTGFDVQFCADGLFTYHHRDHEQAIFENWEACKKDITVPFTASTVAWSHYIQALNILFALVDSGLHTNRNMYLYDIAPITPMDVVRLKYDDNGLAISDRAYGPRTEMGMQRRAGPESVGARIKGTYHDQVVAAFAETRNPFERAHLDPQLWRFLNRFSTSWTTLHLGLFDSSVVVSWSLIERYLIARVDTLISRVAAGRIRKQGKTGIATMKPKEEIDFRGKIAIGESPMAGIMLSVLSARGEHVFPEILTTKLARDSIAHGGTSGDSAAARSGLRACSLIAKETFKIELNNNLGGNPHRGLTP